MPTRNNTFSPLGGSSRSGATNFAPLPVYDFAPAINQQVKFFTDLQKMYARQQAAGAAAQGQLEIIGTNPETGEPIYANVAGKNKDARTASKEIIARDTMKKGLESDVEYQKAKAELYSGNPLSASRQNELVQIMRGRVDTWGKNLGIDKRDAFYAAFGDKEQQAKDAQAAVDKSGTLSALGAGLRMGANSLWGMARQAWYAGNPEERLRVGRETAEANRKITEENPDLRETMLRQQEAAVQGKELGFWDATQGNRFENLAAAAASMGVQFAPAVIASAVSGGLAVPIAAGAISGAGFNAQAMAEQVAQDPNLTEEQKVDALSGGAALLNAGIGGAAGAVMPGRVLNKVMQGAGRIAAGEGIGAVRSRIAQAGANAAARAAAPRSLGRLAGDIAANAGENAGIMAANQMGMNAAYEYATGQDTPFMQGVSDAAIMGATLGVPFGLARYRTRAKAPAAKPAASASAGTDGTTPPSDGGAPAEGVQSMFGTGKSNDAINALVSPNAKQFKADFDAAVASDRMSSDPKTAVRKFGGLTNDEIAQMRDDANFKAFYNELHEAMKSDTPEAIERQNQLIAEYMAGRGAGALKELNAMRISTLQDNIIKSAIGDGDKQVRRFAPADAPAWDAVQRTNFVKRLQEWNATENTNERVSKYFPEGEGRAARILGKPQPAGTAKPDNSGAGKDSVVAEDTPANAGDAAARAVEQAVPRPAADQSGGTGGAAQQGIRPYETPAAIVSEARRFFSEANTGANAPRPRAGGKPTGNGAGSPAGEAGGGAGGGVNGTPTGGGEQPARTARIRTFSDGKANYIEADLGWIKLRKAQKPNAEKPNAEWLFDSGNGYYQKVTGRKLTDWASAKMGEQQNFKLDNKKIASVIENKIDNILIDNAVRMKDPAGGSAGQMLSADEISSAFIKGMLTDKKKDNLPGSIGALAEAYRKNMEAAGEARNAETLRDWLLIKDDSGNTDHVYKSDILYCGG